VNDAALVCENVRAGYGDVCVVREFSMSVEPGTVVALLGPNGAGKTTLLSSLAGLLPIQAGSVTVGGRKVPAGRASIASAAGLVLVPDDRALFASLSVEENLAIARPRRRASLEPAFDRFPELAARRKVAAGSLSGGEQQMLAVARALIQEPRLLLIDEMSMGLAPIIVERLLPMVRSISEDTGAAVLLVEQHVGLALEVADRAMVMVHGEVVIDAPAAELRSNPGLLEDAYLGTVA
jgi:branched-chain amino acid transport system ATP-binding protein